MSSRSLCNTLKLSNFNNPLFTNPSRTFTNPSRTFATSRRLLQQDPANTTKVSSTPRPRPRASNSSQLPVAPLVFIFLFGSWCFHYITTSRDGIGRPGGHQPIPDHTPESKKDWPRNTASDQTLSRR
jgi:hypothetical protein